MSAGSIKGNYFFQGANGISHNGATDVHIGQIGVADARNVIVKATQAGIYSTLQSGGAPLLIENNLIGAGAGLVVGANTTGVFIVTTNGAKVSENIIVNNGKGIAVLVGTGIDYSGNNKIYANGIAVVCRGANNGCHKP